MIDTWPGPVTWVIPSVRFPAWISGGRDSVALRVPGHAQARALCRAFGGPLVSTSANRGGRPASRSPLQALAQLGASNLDYVLPGRVGDAAGPSEIRTLGGAPLRPAAARG